MAAIRYNRFYSDCRQLVLQILNSCIVQYKGGDNFIVYEGIPEVEKVNKGYNYIFLYRMDGSPQEQVTSCLEYQKFGFRVGIIRSCRTDDTNLQDRYFEQLDNLGDQFSNHWASLPYDFTFQGDTITNLKDIGVMELERTPDLHLKGAQSESIEFGVTLSIQFTDINIKAA